MNEKSSAEPKRGCGFRQEGKLYLMGKGVAHICPSLPLPLDPCGVCSFEPTQYRDFTWVPKNYFKALKLDHPTGQPCESSCPICYPEGSNTHQKYGLMWVGKKYYTPEEFIAEDRARGISKAIKQRPKGLVLGGSWVLLAHPQAVVDHEDPKFQEKFGLWMTGDQKGEEPIPPMRPGIFYAFKPNRIEVLVYRHLATPERLAKLEAKGIVAIIIDDEHTAHARRTRRVTGRANIA